MSKRRYGYEGYTCLVKDLGASMCEGISADGTDTKPTIKAMKRFSSQALNKAVIAAGGQDLLDRRGNVTNEVSNTKMGTPFVSFSMDDRFKVTDEDRQETVDMLVKIFGKYCVNVNYMKYGVKVVLSKEWEKDAGVMMLPTISDILEKIYKEHDVGGLGMNWVDKTAAGHRLKREGMELLDDEDWDKFVESVRLVFGDKLVKAKQDGPITGIGYRPVSDGLTNHRFFFKDVKGVYGLK